MPFGATEPPSGGSHVYTIDGLANRYCIHKVYCSDYTRSENTVGFETKTFEEMVKHLRERLPKLPIKPCDHCLEGYRVEDAIRKINNFKQEAEQGNAEAQCELGFRYVNGQGVPQDDKQAVCWLTKAAEKGNIKAQNYLGFCYVQGQGVDKDINKAVYWYRKAAGQGDNWARGKLKELEKLNT